MAGKYHVRSVSLPATSHPTSIRVEQKLNSLKVLQQRRQATSTTTSASICSALSGLEQLNSCVDELLANPTAEAMISTHKREPWVDHLFDASVVILDACSASNDTVLEAKRQVHDLQSALRRRKGDSSIESSLSSYKCLRKRMRKDATKMITALKRVDTRVRASAVNILDIDSSRMIKLLTEATTITTAIFESLLSFLIGAPLSSLKETKWSLVQRLMNRKVAACESELVNEFVHAEAALIKIKCSSSEVDCDALERLATLETSLGGLEKCLENIFRCLVRSRVCLLNMMSH
uniref:Uncharacterized protein n=1 Tax=Kalanchoe fedtschenkoi TaxID=63787 RepID=A0A7N0UG26_KALFE